MAGQLELELELEEAQAMESPRCMPGQDLTWTADAIAVAGTFHKEL